MTDRGDYQDEMPRTPFSDEDVELLLSGDLPEEELLASVAPFVELLRSQGLREPSEIEVARVAVRAAEIARPVRGPIHRAPKRRRRGSKTAPISLRPGLAAAAVAVVVLVVPTLGGAALASDDAIPGDALYGIDQALERIGVGAGGAVERIEEALAMVEDGRVSEALRHASAAVLDDDGEGAGAASQALIDAADGVNSVDGGRADAVRLAVAEMLQWMAANQGAAQPLSGIDFGREVADLASGIANDLSTSDQAAAGPGSPSPEPPGKSIEPDPDPAPGGPPTTAPGGPPTTAPGGPPTTAPGGPQTTAPGGPPETLPGDPGPDAAQVPSPGPTSGTGGPPSATPNVPAGPSGR